MKAATRKVPAKIWRDILIRFDGRVEEVCLRRDAYLSKVIGLEVERLEANVTVPNSKQAANFIAERLDRLDRKLITFTLDARVLDRLNEVCKRKSIVRDAFLNRLIFWLIAPPKIVDRILGADWDTPVWECHKEDIGIYKAALSPLDKSSIGSFIDPLWAVHEHFNLQDDFELSSSSKTEGIAGNSARNESIEMYPRPGFYTLPLNDRIIKNVDLWGLNTYLPDYEVPGTSAQKELDEDWEVRPEFGEG